MTSKENPILIGHLSADFFREIEFSRLFVITDENTGRDCYPQLAGLLPEHERIEIRSGEENKNLETCALIWQKLTDARADRKALVLNLGGGVIGDMGGFCAASFKRGIRFIQIPTTLLAQVDASVGGKLGIDFQGFKNHIGLFRLPEFVLINPDFLRTLPFEELRSGYAEVLKHALIADAAEWKNLAGKKLQEIDIRAVIGRSVEIKRRVVAADPTEQGLRKILNFGHTVGHAAETFYLNTERKLLHGEAVALGMIAETFISVKRKLLSPEAAEEIYTVLADHYPAFEVPEEDRDAIADNALQDKKNSGGIINCTLLSRIGEAVFDEIITAEDILESLAFVNKRAAGQN